MARSKPNFFLDLVLSHWAVGLVFGVLIYLGGLAASHYMAQSSNQIIQAYHGAMKNFATVMAVVCLIAAIVSFIRRRFFGYLVNQARDLEDLRKIDWKDFESLVAEAYRRQGYHVIESPGRGPDGGIDLTLRHDGATHLVQCKQRTKANVGVKVVRELYGLLTAHEAASAILITTSDYTPDAREFAEGKPISLVTGPDLLQLIRSVQPKPAAPSTESPAPTPEPTTRPTATPPTCPRCGQPLVLRQARKGANAGNSFWGCSAFPTCRHSQDAC